MQAKAALLVFFALLIPGSLLCAPRLCAKSDQPTGIEWSQHDAADAGIDATAVRTLYAQLNQDRRHNLKGIVILRDGKLVSECYFNGDTASTLHDIRSATKSITSLLMGIAIQQGLVHGVNDSIASYLPGLPNDGKERITVKDLLNMRSGLDADDDDAATPGNEDNLDKSSDWIQTIYKVPMREAPGTRYNYASINAFLAGVIIENASRMPLDQFANANLFGPLGIYKEHWRHVPVNRVTGQGNLSITARDLAAIGELMLNNGLVNGRQVVSRTWVTQSLAGPVVSSAHDPYSDFYGLMWYTKAEPVGSATVKVHFASGNSGNKVYVISSLRMVIAITSSAYNTNYGQRRSQNILLKLLAAAHPH